MRERPPSSDELDSPPNLVVELTDFSESLTRCQADPIGARQRLMQGAPRSSRPTTDWGQSARQAHVQSISCQVASHLGIAAELLQLPSASTREQLKHLLTKVRERGFQTLYVLVDDVDGSAEAQACPELAEQIVMHLVGNLGWLDIPGLCFKFFLPLSLKASLLKYGGFRTGRIKAIELVWSVDLLRQVIERRLEAASPDNPIDSLRALTGSLEPIDLDDLLVEKAQGSPRRLITLIDMLFRHRAQTWKEPGDEEWRIHISDWAMLLAHLLVQDDRVTGTQECKGTASSLSG